MIKPWVGILIEPQESCITIATVHYVRDIAYDLLKPQVDDSSAGTIGLVVDANSHTDRIREIVEGTLIRMGCPSRHAYTQSRICAKRIKQCFDEPGLALEGLI